MPRQVGELLTEHSKNLTKVETQIKEQVAGAVTQPIDAVKGKIIEYAWWLKKEGYREATIIGRSKLLKILAKRGANLFDPESIKTIIAEQSWSEGRKDLAVDAYSSFLRMTGGAWNPPKYTRIQKIPWIPTEAEIDQLIAATSHRMGTFLLLLKETGIRPGEAWKLKWIDLDSERRTINIIPEKNSNPRSFRLSSKLIERLSMLTETSDKIFGTTKLDYHRNHFCLQRKRIAKKLRNPRLNRITFKTLRHWKATTEYHKTKDILHVMRILGHKNIKNTLIYTQLINIEGDEYVSKVAWNLEEARKLMEAGFDYITDMEGAKLFRKRK